MRIASPAKEFEAESLLQSGSVEKMQYRSLEKWEGTEHPGSDHRNKNKHLIYLASSTTSLNNVPYIHQVYDTPNTFNGHWACNASSALMAITYYGILSYMFPIHTRTMEIPTILGHPMPATIPRMEDMVTLSVIIGLTQSHT